MVNQRARDRVKELVIDEEGLVDIDTDHNALLLSYRWGDDRVKQVEDKDVISVRTDSFWKCRGKNFDNFEADLAELDVLYGGSSAEMNDCLVGKLNKVAEKHFKKVKFKKGKKGRVNKGWWNDEVKEAVRERKRTNRKRREMDKRYKRGDSPRGC